MSASDSESSPTRPQIRDRSVLVLVVGGTFSLQVLTILTGVITARLLGVQGRGEVALVVALGLFASQLTFGASLGNAIAKNLAERQLAARDGLRAIARRRAALLAIPCLAAGGFMLFLQRTNSGGDKYALTAAVVVMTFQTFTFRILVGGLQGETQHVARMAVVGVVPQFLFTVVLATAWIVGWEWSAIDVLMSYFGASFIGLAVGFVALAKPTRRKEDELDERELWSAARHNYFSSVRPIDGVGLDRILVGGLLGTAPLGLYAAATAISNLCRLVGSAVAVIVLPRVAMNHADPMAQRAVIRRWLGASAALVTMIVIGLEAVVDPAIRFAFGEEFAGAIECARWLVLADGLLGFRIVLIAVLQGQGRGSTASWIELALTPVFVLAVVLAALDDNLPAIGIAMAVVGAISCVAHGLALVRVGRRRAETQPVRPPSTTIT